MAGLLNGVFGDNPFYQGFDQRRNAVSQLGLGLMQGKNWQDGLAMGTAGALDGRQRDDAAAMLKQQEQERLGKINSTIEFMRQKGFGDLVAGVEGGGLDIGAAWQEALRRSQPQAAPDPTANQNDYNFYANQEMQAGRAPMSFADWVNPMTAPSAPSGYQWADGQLQYIPGGPADPSTQAKTTEAQRRNQQLASVIQPELQSVEDNWEALADGGNQTWGSNPVTAGIASPQYQQARNSLSVIAQSYLYSVSGAAATDAEVQKIVDSVTPKPFESAESIAAKKRRIQQMADAVIQAGGGATPAGNVTSSGLQWSLEP